MAGCNKLWVKQEEVDRFAKQMKKKNLKVTVATNHK
jgi:hypothetical protein